MENSYLFDVYIKDNSTMSGYRVDKVVGTSFGKVISAYEANQFSVCMIKCISPVKIA